jgi:hypothetical protein
MYRRREAINMSVAKRKERDGTSFLRMGEGCGGETWRKGN